MHELVKADPAARLASAAIAFVRACGATGRQEQPALKLWRQARAESRGILAHLKAPSVGNIRTFADLITALAAQSGRVPDQRRTP
ncbi:hypothetical protein [Streptomyces albogriseolus]|uniref:hypothetical protein n=1 Tax=Streptomyces albogriseolus TaxID=1887 RepID=UPI003460A2FD